LIAGGLSAALSTLATATSPVAHRELTTILYLNESDWDVRRDGGQLRLFGGALPGDRCGETATEIVDVAPLGGRLVVFESRRVADHGVSDPLTGGVRALLCRRRSR
jgi:Rps23 Pro-64 3,4-dihydroxylase Tpa1-like proline 4-hydroxylase